MGRSADGNAFTNADGAAYHTLTFRNHTWKKHRNFNPRFGNFLYWLACVRDACIDNAVTAPNQYRGPGNAYPWTWDTSTAGLFVAGDSSASYICRHPAATQSPGA